jgi:formate dehydrogenase maturation protein FdhE
MNPIGTVEVWQVALARWAEIARNFPDLEPALALQQRMLRILLDAAQQLDGDTAEPLAISSDAVLGKWMRGVPALRNAATSIPPRLKEALPALCDVLVEGGAGDAVQHVRSALAKREIDADSLLRVSLARNEKAIRTSALHMGLSPDLVWLVGELGSSPLAHHVQKRLLGREDLAQALSGWDRGYCPCCGSWPALIEVLNESRLLRCSFCAASWELTSKRCVYCANAADNFVTAAPDVSRRNRRLDLCGTCGSYTKVIEVIAATPFPLLAIEDLATVDLDQGAMAREYGRPKLFDLDAIEPRLSVDGECA